MSRSYCHGLATVHVGDALSVLQHLPSESVNCVVTSPPYWGLRDYGVEGQIGLEPTPAEFLERMTAVFAEVYRVLRKDGTCWVNMGDSYSAGSMWSDSDDVRFRARFAGQTAEHKPGRGGATKPKTSVPPKNLLGIPWRLAFALQDAGWILRSDIIWAKPNPMPESVRDRPTKAHEYVFLLTKSGRYWYDADAIREESTGKDAGNGFDRPERLSQPNGNPERWRAPAEHRRNARSVWNIATQAYPEAHFATFPEELPRRCILAGCPVGGIVLDPFAGSGTTLSVAVSFARKAIGIELNPQYAELIGKRLSATQPTLEVLA